MKKIFFVSGLLLSVFSYSQTAQVAQHLPFDVSSIGFCGTSGQSVFDENAAMKAKMSGISNFIQGNANSSLLTSQGNFPTNLIVPCGSHFRIYYEDLNVWYNNGNYLGPQGGFADATYGSDRQGTFCDVLQQVENTLNIPNGVIIDIYVQQSYSSIHPANSSIGFLASAGPYYTGTPGYGVTPGYYGGDMHTHITSGSDPDLTNYDAFVTVNFDVSYGNNSVTYISYWDNHNNTNSTCKYDLFSVLLHEVTHELGFFSDIGENSSYLPYCIVANRGFTLYDQYFLWKGDVTNPSTFTGNKLVINTSSGPDLNPSIASTTNVLRSDLIWTTSNPIPDNQPVYAGVFDPYYIATVIRQSLISHLNLNVLSFTGMSQFSPGYQPHYVMGPFFERTERRDVWTIQEMRMLLTLGYTLNSSFALSFSLGGGTMNNGALLNNNHPPFRNDNATPITNYLFLNNPPNFVESLVDFTLVNDNTPTLNNQSSIIIDVSSTSDGTHHDNDNDPISIMPGSIFGIRGVSDGTGNNHNKLVQLTSTTLKYTPLPGYIGKAQFGFYLYDGHERGSMEIYTIDVQPGNYTANVGDDLMINGTFEDGTEVRQWPSNASFPNTGMENRYQEGPFAGEILSGGHPYSYYSNEWDIAGGALVKDAWVESCAMPTFTGPNQNYASIFQQWSTQHYTTTLQNYVSPTSVTTTNPNERYQVFNGTNFSTLINPVQTCHDYTLEFDMNLQNTTYSVGQTFGMNLEFISDPTAILIPNFYTTYATVPLATTITTVAADSWQHCSFTFKYCGTTPTRYINLKTAGFFLPYTAPYIDNLVFYENTAPPPMTVSATASPIALCSGSNTSTLTATAYPLQCGVTYTWQPGNLSGQSVSVSPTSTTTYTLTATASGCVPTQTATTTITVQVSNPTIPVITTNSSTLCNSSNVTYTVTNYDPNFTYTPTFSPAPISWSSPLSGIFVVNWGFGCPDAVLTITSSNGNPACSASASITLQSCCPCTVPSGDVVVDGNSITDVVSLYNYLQSQNSSQTILTHVGGAYTYNNPGHTLWIDGTFTIPVGITSLTFSPLSEIRMGTNAKIKITATNCTVNFNQTHIAAGCGNMWDGIYYSGIGNMVTFSGTSLQASLFEDAQNGLVASSGGKFRIDHTVFNKNIVSVQALAYTGNYQGSISSSVFTSRVIPSAFSGLQVSTLIGATALQCPVTQSTVGTYSTTTLLPRLNPVAVPVQPITNTRGSVGVFLDKLGSSSVNSNTHQITSSTGITIGDNSSNAANVFDNLDYGIYAQNSNLTAQNNVFQNMSGPAVIKKGMQEYGIGIYGTNDVLSFIRKITVGPNQNKSNTFYDCNRGVDLNGYYDLTVTNNCFKSNIVYNPGLATQSLVGNYAAFVKSGKYINVAINDNNIVNWAFGIAFFSEYLQTGNTYTRTQGMSYINNNNISPVSSGPITTQYVGTAITAHALSLNCGTCSFTQNIYGYLHINNNSNPGLIDVFNGIDIQGWPLDLTIVADNYVALRYQPNFSFLTFKQAGIKSVSCPYVNIYRNTIWGDVTTGNTTGKFEMRGIFAISNMGAQVRCNSVSDVGQCMVFNGNNTGNVTNNTMNASIKGLVLENSGIIGPQGLYSGNGVVCDNLWSGPFSLCATYVADVGSCATFSPLYVRSMSPPYSPLPCIGPSALCTYAYFTYPITAIWEDPALFPNPTTFNCNLPPPAIANQNNNNGNGPIKRMMELIVQDSIPFSSFATELSWMNKHNVYAMLQSDPTLMNNSTVLQQFYNSAPTTNIGKTVSTDIQLVQSNTASASSINQTITPSLMPEQNYKDVNDIYISLLNGNIADSVQLQTLESIAAQCPDQGGVAVYRARDLLILIYDNIRYWDDNCPSSQRIGDADSSSSVIAQQSILLFPNPNDGNMTLTYILPDDQQGQIAVYDVMGKLVYQQALLAGVQQQPVILTELSSGMYYYKVMFNGQLVKADKFVINK